MRRALALLALSTTCITAHAFNAAQRRYLDGITVEGMVQMRDRGESYESATMLYRGANVQKSIGERNANKMISWTDAVYHAESFRGKSPTEARNVVTMDCLGGIQ
ncbi:hypothetical protein R69927_00159 [Paraburkholderia domus]|uniref:Uncharacterized protein n=1 Tax=Paraburkholderia domus TaxID=2793075 RepID=A0A9N8MJT3_9BURK|nr:hypothetical protein [Paraburkholderia domus]MBK5047625.1 hypothetical protein [Burkholderia sp. R-70006]MBK5062755.1 hypothetical protein [Burkholderia sp. R-70199]MBK5084882.1 hypothetical protein [Burkholderia sp. R-69927]MBK5119795.1 hypothetical protein [Burkholderia sp. R-69980]MBK5163962.1 hypothetical protein [Burkholderia sp. R-70211]MBK5178782.1 hypothetical protein [Burkholderia sp. R-69749]MCI0148497.1 hypothetical protein [Paraburkholderia sediminicola]